MNKEQTKPSINFKLIRRILSYTSGHKLNFWAAIIITILLSFLSIVRPILISDTLYQHVELSSDLNALNNACLLILGLILTEALLQYINTNITNLLGQSIIKELRDQIYHHVSQLKSGYFDKTPIGTLVTRVVSDIESLSDVFSQGFIVIMGDMLMLIVFAGAMLWKNWMLALIVFSTIPLLSIATNIFKNGVKKTFTMVRNAVSDLNTFVQERLTGMQVVQLFNKEESEYSKFKEINKRHRDANIKSIFYYSVFFPVVEILSSISIALIIWFSGKNNNVLHVNLGDLTFFIMLTNMMFRPIRMLADRLNTLQMGMVSAERVFKVIDTNEVIDKSGEIPFHKLESSIEFKDVWFAYNDENYVLKDIQLAIHKGERVAFVGTTGSGKSTIINLLSRFYEHQKGQILINGIETRQYDLVSLRKNTGVVLQDVFLFNDTILNNITLYNESISTEMVLSAIESIGLKDFISDLPGGLNYIVKERGSSLSAGQRQLVAFIRAYVYNPEIFVLDEATASIDTPTELLIQKAIHAITQNRTSIIIAHRLSTIRDANKIFVLEHGEIIESGSPDELLKRGGKFKSLYENQYQDSMV